MIRFHPGESNLKQFWYNVVAFYEHFYVKLGAQKPTLAQSALKTVEEIGEFAGTIAKSKPKIDQENEWADVLFSHLHTAILADYDIQSAMERIATKNAAKFDTAVVIDGIIVKKSDLIVDNIPTPTPRTIFPDGNAPRDSVYGQPDCYAEVRAIAKKWWQIWQ